MIYDFAVLLGACSVSYLLGWIARGVASTTIDDDNPLDLPTSDSKRRPFDPFDPDGFAAARRSSNDMSLATELDLKYRIEALQRDRQ